MEPVYDCVCARVRAFVLMLAFVHACFYSCASVRARVYVCVIVCVWVCVYGCVCVRSLLCVGVRVKQPSGRRKRCRGTQQPSSQTRPPQIVVEHLGMMS